MKKVGAIFVALALVCAGMLLTVPAAAGDMEPMATSNPRVVLAELYTDASDDDCPEAHQALQQLANEYGRHEVVMLAWHSVDDLAFQEGNDRITWAMVNEFPTAIFDGITANIGGGLTAEDVKHRYNSHIEQRIDVPSPLKMTVEWQFNTLSGEGTVWVNITAVEDISITDLRLHTVVFENQVGPYDGGNGEMMHDFVAREFLETDGDDGEPISIELDETIRYTYSIDASYAEDLDQVGVMAFVQSHSQPHEVLQAAYVGVPTRPNQPPVLSQATLDTSMGNTEDDEVTFKVFYKDVDDTRNKGPTEVKVHYKTETSAVTEVDLSPEEETGNWYEGRMMVYTTKLTPGLYTYRFSASDGKDDATGDVDWSTTPVEIHARNALPEMQGSSYAPGSGDTATIFRFEVQYRDMDNIKPEVSNIVLDDKDLPMSTDSEGPWDNWVYFYYETTLSMGSHSFYYEFSDGTDMVRYPSEDAVPNWIAGPTVTAQNDIPTLTTPNHYPEDGIRSTKFEFNIIYTDAENDPPLMPRIYIDNRPGLMTADSEDYDQGVMFVYETNLEIGDHEYYFWFSDGINDIRYPKTGMLEGPSVVNQGPEAVLEFPQDGDVFEANQIVHFSAVLSRDLDGDILRYTWTSDKDGQLGTVPDFTTHLTSGLHEITLEVSDDFGGTDTETIQITMKEESGHPYFEGYLVRPTYPMAMAAVEYFVTVNNDGQVDSIDQILEFSVNGYVVSTPTVTVEVNSPIDLKFEWIPEYGGSYIVKFTIGDETLEIIQDVLHNAPPMPQDPNDATPIENTKPKAGKAVHFGANVMDPDGDEMTYEWDFGDGTTSYEANPTHTYDKAGEYTVTVSCTDCNNVTKTWTKTVQVTKPTSEGDTTSWGGFAVIAAVIVVILILLVAVFVRRRQ